MPYWLLKTEPSTYAAADLKRDGRTTWDGVANPAAVKNIRSMKPGDEAFIYHTGDERRCVAIAEVVSEPNVTDPKAATVDLKFKSMLATPVTLDQIKADKAFEGWDLIRLGRLSVVPTSAVFWKHIVKLASAKPAK